MRRRDRGRKEKQKRMQKHCVCKRQDKANKGTDSLGYKLVLTYADTYQSVKNCANMH